MSTNRPAYSAPFIEGAPPSVPALLPTSAITADWAWGGSTGAGVKVAIIDSGIESAHPAIVGAIAGYHTIDLGPHGLVHSDAPHGDNFGHGTACAGIIRGLAPDCELYSVRVLGTRLSGRGEAFVAGLRWAIDAGMQVCNLSLGTTKRDFFGVFHELADEAYFRRVLLVAAANNMPIPSFPAVYASVISVASHAGRDSRQFYYNPAGPVEFGARGIDVRVAWAGGGWLTATGNSYAAPHITGLVALLLAKHPGLNLTQVKIVLRTLAANARPS